MCSCKKANLTSRSVHGCKFFAETPVNPLLAGPLQPKGPFSSRVIQTACLTPCTFFLSSRSVASSNHPLFLKQDFCQ